MEEVVDLFPNLKKCHHCNKIIVNNAVKHRLCFECYEHDFKKTIKEMEKMADLFLENKKNNGGLVYE